MSKLQIVNKTGLASDTLLRLDDRPLADCYSCDVHLRAGDGLVKVKLGMYAVNAPDGMEMSEEFKQRFLALPHSHEITNIELTGAYIEMFVKTLWPDDLTRPDFTIIVDPSKTPVRFKAPIEQSIEERNGELAWRERMGDADGS